MPIRPENKNRYPKDWKDIRDKIVLRANNQCEFDVDGARCKAINYQPHPITKSKVILTVAHLNHTPEDCRDENLKAACQKCHNTYDAPMRVEGIKKRKLQAIKDQHKSLKEF